MSGRGGTQRRGSVSAGCDSEVLLGKELRPARLEGNCLEQETVSCHDGKGWPRTRRPAQRRDSLSGSLRQLITPEVWNQTHQATYDAGCRQTPRGTRARLILIGATMTWWAGQTDAERRFPGHTFYVRVPSPRRKRPGRHFSGSSAAARRLPVVWAVRGTVPRPSLPHPGRARDRRGPAPHGR